MKKIKEGDFGVQIKSNSAKRHFGWEVQSSFPPEKVLVSIHFFEVDEKNLKIGYRIAEYVGIKYGNWSFSSKLQPVQSNKEEVIEKIIELMEKNRYYYAWGVVEDKEVIDRLKKSLE